MNEQNNRYNYLQNTSGIENGLEHIAFAMNNIAISIIIAAITIGVLI